MRLIDADALGIGRANEDIFDCPEYAKGWNSAIDIIQTAPTVDAVEVVRCRDCIYCEKAYLYSTAEVDINDKCCTFNERLTNDDYFCPYGERR